MKSYFPTPIAGTSTTIMSSETLNKEVNQQVADQGISIRAKFAESFLSAIIIASKDKKPVDVNVADAISYADELIKQLGL